MGWGPCSFLAIHLHPNSQPTPQGLVPPWTLGILLLAFHLCVCVCVRVCVCVCESLEGCVATQSLSLPPSVSVYLCVFLKSWVWHSMYKFTSVAPRANPGGNRGFGGRSMRELEELHPSR